MLIFSKKCEQCGKSFSGDNSHGKDSWRKRKYCSYECKSAAQVGPRIDCLTKSCEHCGRKFRNRRANGRAIEPGRWATQRFCTPECKQASQKGKAPPNKGVREDLMTRFMRFVRKETSGKKCWTWTGAMSGKYYGYIQVDGKKSLAHRVSWILHHGPIPEGEGYHGVVIRHSCDNPQCVNPEHLELGTQYQNMRDRDERGRRTALVGEEHGRSKLLNEDVELILQLAGRASQTKIAKLFGISVSMVNLIINRKNWKHLP